MSSESTIEPADKSHSEATSPKRTIRIEIRLNGEERELLRRHAAAHGMKISQYVRAVGLGQRIQSRVYAELAREVLAIGQAVMQAAPMPGRERERLLSRIRPLLRRISSHLP